MQISKLITYLITIILFSSQAISQDPYDTDVIETEGGPTANSAQIIAKVTFDGNPLLNVDWIAAFETFDTTTATNGPSHNLIAADVFLIFNDESYLNLTLVSDHMGRNQLSTGENFTFEIYIANTAEYIPVVIDIGSSITNGTEINFSRNSNQGGVPTAFGPYVPQPTNGFMPGWEFGSNSFNALPVEYSSITLTNKDCRYLSLDWTTSSEIDNEGFYVERSVEGNREWEQLDFINGNGTSSEEIDYTFTDKEITKNKSLKVVYYRLKQVDYNGRIEYSETKSVRLNCGNTTYINIFPNPFFEKASLTLNHDDLKDDNVTFKIFSIDGQLVSDFTKSMSDKETIEIETSNFSAGLYRIQASTYNQIIAHTRFIKN